MSFHCFQSSLKTVKVWQSPVSFSADAFSIPFSRSVILARGRLECKGWRHIIIDNE